MRVLDRVDALERWTALDRVSGVLRRGLDAVLPGPAAKDLLHGVWLGHPLHPMLIVVPLGSWISAGVLDLLPGRPGRRDAARTLVGLGVVAAVPTALAGAADWSELHPEQQRVGLVHATANTVALTFAGLSWQARRRDRHGRGVLLSALGLTASAVGGFLGGHLAYRQAAGANHAEEAPHVLPGEFAELCRLADLPDGAPVRLLLGATPLFALRQDRDVRVLFDQCSHLAGPLHGGEVVTVDGAECVRCPWHGSTFRLDDGHVVRGPATAPQPWLETKLAADGTVHVRLPRP